MGTRVLLCLLAALVALPAAAASPTDAEYHFLRVDGKALFLERAALNGRTVLSGTLISLSLPLWVDKYLNDGPNELELEYTSDKVEGLTVVIETRTRGAKKTEAVRFHSAAGETGGKKVTKTISFSLHVPQPSAPVRLTDPDRQAIGGIVQAQYDLLVRRDAAGLRRLYEKAMGEEAQIYPEGVEFFKTVLDQSGKVLASPQFRMKPFDRSGLQFTIDGQRVNVSRADRSPIMESGPVEIEDELVFTQNGKEVHEKQKVRSKVGPMSEAFRMFDGRWYLALPFGP